MLSFNEWLSKNPQHRGDDESSQQRSYMIYMAAESLRIQYERMSFKRDEELDEKLKRMWRSSTNFRFDTGWSHQTFYGVDPAAPGPGHKRYEWGESEREAAAKAFGVDPEHFGRTEAEKRYSQKLEDFANLYGAKIPEEPESPFHSTDGAPKVEFRYWNEEKQTSNPFEGTFDEAAQAWWKAANVASEKEYWTRRKMRAS